MIPNRRRPSTEDSYRADHGVRWSVPSVFVLAPVYGALVSCGWSPSRAPLGGDYGAAPVSSSALHAPLTPAAATARANPGVTEQDPDKPPRIATALPSSAAGGAGGGADLAKTVRYEPFSAGDQIRAELAFSVSATVQGSYTDLRGGKGQITLDAKLHVDVKIVKSSAQSLDELEVTLKPISLHTEFDGQSSDSKQDPPETYDVTLSGQSPNIRVLSGAPLEDEDRATLLLLVTPLVEFHNHWARSPTLSLTPGWSSNVPIATPAFLAAPGESVKAGPLSVRYGGRDSSVSGVPFDLSLPAEWTMNMGRLNFNLTGRALLGARGRPLSLNLSGPITGDVSSEDSRSALRGTATFAVALSYP